MSVDGDDTTLRAAGLRVTAPRLATLAVVADRQHADAETIVREVRARIGSASKQAVYDILHALTDAGLVRRISVDERRSRFELNRHDNHHHYVCRTCGRIEDVPCPVGAPPCLEPDPALGFATEAADVTYKGQCRECRPAP